MNLWDFCRVKIKTHKHVNLVSLGPENYVTELPLTFRYFANHRAAPSIAQIKNFSNVSALFGSKLKIEYGNEFNSERMVEG